MPPGQPELQDHRSYMQEASICPIRSAPQSRCARDHVLKTRHFEKRADRLCNQRSGFRPATHFGHAPIRIWVCPLREAGEFQPLRVQCPAQSALRPFSGRATLHRIRPILRFAPWRHQVESSVGCQRLVAGGPAGQSALCDQLQFALGRWSPPMPALPAPVRLPPRQVRPASYPGRRRNSRHTAVRPA